MMNSLDVGRLLVLEESGENREWRLVGDVRLESIGTIDGASKSLSVRPSKIELAMDLSPGGPAVPKPDGYRCEYTTPDGKTDTLPVVFSGIEIV